MNWKNKFPKKNIYFENNQGILYNRDTLKLLKELPDESVDLIITSPPYYGLRNYQVEGQIGLEETFEEYLEKLLRITAELKRVLKKSGQLWWNMGDCYAAQPTGTSKALKNEFGKKYVIKGKSENEILDIHSRQKKKFSVPSKCLLMQPERLAIRMIDQQGWILRNKVVWAKQIYLKKQRKTIGSVMPTSVKDRFNESWEYLYFFVKNKKYYSDLDAVRIPPQTELNIQRPRMGQGSQTIYNQKRCFNIRVRETEKKEAILRRGNHSGYFDKDGKPRFGLSGKNIPTVWQINPQPHNFRKELGVDIDHFAAFPESLVETPIKFGCPQGGVVLDPFAGTGSSLIVALRYDRNFIGIELNPDYCEIINRRIKKEGIQKKLF